MEPRKSVPIGILRVTALVVFTAVFAVVVWRALGSGGDLPLEQRSPGAEASGAAPQSRVTASAETDPDVRQVSEWLESFKRGGNGNLPETFSVLITLDGYSPESDGPRAPRPRETYEFTSTEVRRLCRRAEGYDMSGDLKFAKDEQGNEKWEVRDSKPFSKIAHVCRILLALDYAGMLTPEEEVDLENPHYLQVVTDWGLPQVGGAGIYVKAKGVEVSVWEHCIDGGMDTTAKSIRFAALYHTLRRLARSSLGIGGRDWRDAREYIGVDGSIQPAESERAF
jgi:hypothetical protein